MPINPDEIKWDPSPVTAQPDIGDIKWDSGPDIEWDQPEPYKAPVRRYEPETPEAKWQSQPGWKKAISALPAGPGTLLRTVTKTEPMPWERAAFGPEAPEITKSIDEGYKQVIRSFPQTAHMLSESLGELAGMEAGGFFKRIADTGMLQGDQDFQKRAEEKNVISKYIQDVTGMGPQIATQYATYFLGGRPLSMAFMGTQIAGPFYEQLRADGVPPLKAFKAAIANASAQSALEALPMGVIFKRGGKKLLNRIIGGAGAEFFTEWAQKYPELFSESWAKDEKVTAEKLWNATKEGMYEGLVAAPFGGFGGAVSRRAVDETPPPTDLMTGETTDLPETVKTRDDARDILNAVQEAQQEVPVEPPVQEMPIPETAPVLEQEIPAEQEVVWDEDIDWDKELPITKPVKKSPRPPKKAETFDEYYAALPETDKPFVKDLAKDKEMPDAERLALAKQEIISRKKKAKAQYRKEIEVAQQETLKKPTKEQIESGVYKKGRVRVHGFEGVIETPKEQERLPGVKVKNPVGYIRRVEGKDGDQLDAIFGPDGDTTNIHVVDQFKGGKFDEHKVVFGFKSREAARRAWKQIYGTEYKEMGIVEMSPSEFKKWTAGGKVTKPVSQEPPISEKEWIEDTSVRPPQYISKQFMPGATDSKQQLLNQYIMKDYQQYLKDMGYKVEPKKSYQKALAPKKADKRSAPVRYYEEYLLRVQEEARDEGEEIKQEIAPGDIKEHTKLNWGQKLAKSMAGVLNVDLAFHTFPEGYIPDESGVFMRGPNTISIRSDTEKPALFILGHEIMHNMQAELPDVYNDLREKVWQHRDQFDLEAFADVYPGDLPLSPWSDGYSEGDHTLLDEFMPEWASHQIFKPEFWNAVVKKDPSTFGKIVDAITKVLSKIRALIPATETHVLNFVIDYENMLMDALADAYVKFGKRPVRRLQPKDVKRAQANSIEPMFQVDMKGPVNINKSYPSYSEASQKTGKGAKNILVRPGKKQGKYLMVQISSGGDRAMAPVQNTKEGIGDKYYKKLYKNRQGYTRPADFWEVPEWVAMAAKTFPDSDFYVVRNVAEARQFLKQAGYESVMFSVMDANKQIVKDLVSDYPGKVITSGYIRKDYFKDNKNVKWVNSIEEAAKYLKVKYNQGVDYKHFKGTSTIPRLELSRGCLHNCAFCMVPKDIIEANDKFVDDQLRAFKDLNFQLIYLNDKTFGQAKNYKKLKDLYEKVKGFNPDFEGFVIQTTAPAFLGLDPQFIKDSGIKYVELGVETYNDKILKDLKKPHNTKLIDKAVSKIRDLNLNFIPNVIVGLAGVKNGKLWTETQQTYTNTLNFLKKNRDITSHVNVYVLATYEGTTLAGQLNPETEQDSDENVIAKSWMKNQKTHEGFYKDVLDFGSEQLDKGLLKSEALSQIDFIKDIPKQAKGIKANGAIGTPLGNKLYWLLPEMIEDAVVPKSKTPAHIQVRNFFKVRKEWRGFGITDVVAPTFMNQVKKYTTDKKFKKKYDEIRDFRNKVAAGQIEYFSPAYDKMVDKYGADLKLHTVKHTERFAYSKTQSYGPTDDVDIKLVVKKDHPILGEIEVEVWKDPETGNEIIPGPIFSLDRNERLEEIVKIINKNKFAHDWYVEWNEFMKQWAPKVGDKKIVQYIKIQGILSAQTGPQANQLSFAQVVDQLEETGELLEGATGDQVHKIRRVWDGLDTETTYEEFIETYGKKVGAYIWAGLHPMQEDAVVIDRHMSKPWGYNIMWDTEGGFNRMSKPPEVVAEVAGDIMEAAKMAGVSINATQAALWFEIRKADIEAATYRQASQIKADEYLPNVMYAETLPEDMGKGVHFKKTYVKPGRYIYAAKKDGSITPNEYSRADVINRMDASSEKNPYAELVYAYEAKPELKPEPHVTTGRIPHSIDFSKSRIYDGINDMLGFRKSAEARIKLDENVPPGMKEHAITNAFANLIEQSGYDGFAYKQKDKRVIAIFGRAAVTHAPEATTIALSDVIESVEKLPQKMSELEEALPERAYQQATGVKTMLDNYAGLNLGRVDATMARFGDVTSGVSEIGSMVTVNGPADAARAFSAQWGASKAQNFVLVIRGPQENEAPTGKLYSTMVDKGLTADDIEKALERNGVTDFNIGVKEGSGRLFIEQYFADKGEYAPSEEDVRKFMNFLDDVSTNNPVEISDVVADGIDSSQYEGILKDYFGEKTGGQLYEEAQKAKEKHFDKVKEGQFGERVGEQRQDDIEESIRKNKGLDSSLLPQKDLEILGPAEDQWQPALYSELRNFVQSPKFQPGTPDKVKAFLETQMYSKAHPFKKDEYDWSGVSAWLDLQPKDRKIKAKDIVKFMEKYSIKFREIHRGATVHAEEALVDYIRQHYYVHWYDSQREYYDVMNMGERFPIEQFSRWPGWVRRLYKESAEEEGFEIESDDDEVLLRAEAEMLDWWDDAHLVLEPYSGDIEDGSAHILGARILDNVTHDDLRSENGAYNHLDEYLEEQWAKEDDEYLLEMYGEMAQEDMNHGEEESVDEDDGLPPTEAKARWGQSGYNLPGGENYRELQVVIDAPQTLWEKEKDAGNLVRAEVNSVLQKPNHFALEEEGATREGVIWIKQYKNDLLLAAGEFEDGNSSLDDFLDVVWNINEQGEYLAKHEKLPQNLWNAISVALVDLETAARDWVRVKEQAKKEAAPRPKELGFRIPAHWDEENVLYHIRYDTRFTPGKKKVMFVQEMQSDWHQQGRARGYRGGEENYRIQKTGKVVKATQEEFEKTGWPVDAMREQTPGANDDSPVYYVVDLNDDTDIKFATMFDRRTAESIANRYEAIDISTGNPVTDRDGVTKRWREKEDALDFINKMEFDAIPDAPFKSNWYIQAFKRLVRYAAEADYDYIAMTTGEQQVDRWNQLLKQVERVEWDPNEKLLLGYGPTGELVIEKKNVEANELDDYMGKAAATELLASEPTDAGFHWVENIEIGGRFLRNLYNKKIPRDINKLFNKKKWGKARMGFGTFSMNDSGDLYTDKDLEETFPSFTTEVAKKQFVTSQVLSMPVTREMKNRVLTEGMPLYNVDLKTPITKEAKEVIDKKIGPKGKSLREKLRRSFRDARENWQTRMFDRLHPIKEWLGESKAYMLARGIPGIQSTVDAFLKHGKLRFDESGALITDTIREGFLPWYDRLGKDGEKFFYWVVAKRAQVLKKEKREFLFNDSDIQKILRWVGPKPTDSPYNSWEEINREFKEFNNNILDIAQKSGIIDKDFRDYMQSQGYYVPFYRIMQDDEERVKFFTGKQRPKEISANIKKLRGSDAPIGDPVENMLRNWTHLLSESIHNAARRATFAQAIRENIVAYQDENGKDVPLVQRVPWSQTVVFKQLGEKGDKDAPTFVHKKEGYPVLQIRAAGKNLYFKVNDPELYNALGQMDTPVFDNIFMALMREPKRALTYGATFGPAFRVKNFLRDTLHTFQISKGFIPLISSIKGVYKILKKDPDYIRFMSSGMAFGGSYIRESDPDSYKKFVDRVVKREGKGALRHILDSPAKLLRFWENIGEAAENAARVELYSIRRKEGKSHLRAAFEARDLMDFNMSGNGQVVKFLISTVPFMNARMQGLYKMGRAAMDDPSSFFTKSGMIALASLALWWLNKDDDRYKELEDFEKFAWYHFWIGDTHFRIPKPFETGVLFSTSVEAAADVIKGNEELGHLFDYLTHATMETLAFNPTPQAIRPVFEQYANKTFFTGRPIESLAMQRRTPGERYDPWDSETLRLLGEKLNMSPKRAQAFIRGYTSTFGMFLLGISDAIVRNVADFPERPTKRIDDYPLVGAFARQADDPRYTKFFSEFYDAYREINELAGNVSHFKRAGDLEKAKALTEKYKDKFAYRKILNRKYKKLSDLSVKIKKTWLSSLTPDEKKKQIDKYTRERNQIVREVYNTYLKGD